MTEFFQTVMGRQFFDATMPRIARAIEALNQSVGELNAQMTLDRKARTDLTVETEGQPELYDENDREICQRCGLLWSYHPVSNSCEEAKAAAEAEAGEAPTPKADRVNLQVESPVLQRIQAVLWPGGDEEHEWDSDTFCELAEAMHDAGFGPEKT